MATYKITAPDGQAYNITAPDDASQDDVMAYAQRNFKMLPKETSLARDVLQHGGNLLAGAVRGAGSIGATLMRPFDTATENKERRQAMDDALQSFGAEPDSWMYGGGKLAGEFAGTAGAGGVLARGASMIPGLASAAPGLINSIRTAGMTTGVPVAAGTAGKLANVGVRMAGGAINGAAMSGVVGDNVGVGAAVGAAVGGLMPPVLSAAGKAGAAAAKKVPLVWTPEKQLLARKIAQMSGMSIDDVAAAMKIQGPSMTGVDKTVPQILQNPAISQLQRTVINASDNNPLVSRELEQNAQRMAALERVAPIAGSVNEAADVAGSAIQNYAVPARAEAGKRVNDMFESVDPFMESRFELPIEQMKNARDKFLGPGTFGSGSRANAAITEAERIGTEVLPGIAPLAKEAKSNSQTLEQAVRAAGGIRGYSGELRDLGIKQSGTTGLINNKSGNEADILAQDMYDRGFIPDASPDTLIEALRNGGGRKLFANDQVESNAMQRMAEQAMGDAPGDEIVAKAVPFREVQNLRSSLSEAWNEASMKGRNKEAAALNDMIGQIDNRVKYVAKGQGNPGEYFPADMVASWREALDAHAAKKLKFGTGPQAGMFRKGGDGQASIQGAEIPPKFFSPKLSQVEDAQAFKRLIGDDETLSKLLKSYAVTDAANQANKGVLSDAKLSKWMASRSGAIKGIFNEQEQAMLSQIGASVRAADGAATLGMAKGSNTAQNIEAAKRAIGSGLLDNPLTELMFNRIPVLKNISGPVLKTLRDKSAASKAETIGGLLADPAAFESELTKLIKGQQPSLLGRMAMNPMVGQSLYRAAPLIGAGQ